MHQYMAPSAWPLPRLIHPSCDTKNYASPQRTPASKGHAKPIAAAVSDASDVLTWLTQQRHAEPGKRHLP